MDFLHAVVAGLTLHDPDANLVNATATLRKSTRLTERREKQEESAPAE